MSVSGFAFDSAQVASRVADTRFAGHFHHVATTPSTNQLALDAAATGARNGVWVADEQTAGRGRGGHAWHSAPGDGLYLSALVAPGIALSHAGWLPLAAGLSVQAAVEECTGLRADIRWPNDLMLDDKKVGGVLVETSSEPQTAMLHYAVIGIGLNVNHVDFPDDLRHAATSLKLEAGSGRGTEFRLEALSIAILEHLDQDLRQLNGAELLERFEAASTWARGRQVQVGESGGYTGVTCGLDPLGFLRVRTASGEMRTVLSGGVRPIDSAA